MLDKPQVALKYGQTIIGKENGKLVFKCPKGHIYSNTWREFQKRKSKCKECSGVKSNKHTFEEIKQITEDLGFKFLSDSYIDQHSIYKYECPEGHTFEQSWKVFIRNPKEHNHRFRCAQCSINSRKISVEAIKESYSAENYTINEPFIYKNKDALFKVTCPKSHTYNSSWNKWRQGLRCPYCAGQIVTIEDVKRRLNILQYELVSGDYEGSSSPLMIKCREGHIYKSCWQKLQQFYGCPRCSSSPQEKEIADWLKSLGQEVIENSRDVISGELDVYLPDHKLAIEYNGLYFHSERFRPNNYHLDKLKKCLDKNIQLIQIFEHEWGLRKDQVKAFIQSKLGLNLKIPARKTEIYKPSKQESSEFFNRNHILGSCSGDVVALKYNGQMVMAICFSKHHRGGENIVLSRLCSEHGITVVGGLEKLTKNSGYKEFITFADRRFSEGKAYAKIGMKLSSVLRPDYFYTRSGQYYSKQNLKKTKEERKLGKTESILREEQGFTKVWDCGKLVYRMG